MPAQPPAPTAYDVLVEKVFAPVFFAKLANDFGIVPQTVDEQRDLLFLAESLKSPEVKQAAARPSLIGEAADGLRDVLTRAGVDHASPTAVERQIKQAADAFLADADVATAAEVWARS